MTKFVYGHGNLHNPIRKYSEAAFESRDALRPYLGAPRYIAYGGCFAPSPLWCVWLRPKENGEFDHRVIDSFESELLDEFFGEEKILLRSPALNEPPCHIVESAFQELDTSSSHSDSGDAAENGDAEDNEDVEDNEVSAEDGDVEDNGENCQKQDSDALIKLLAKVSLRAHEKRMA